VISLSGVSFYTGKNLGALQRVLCCAKNMPIFANACGGANTPSGARLSRIGIIKIKLKILAHPPNSVPK